MSSEIKLKDICQKRPRASIRIMIIVLPKNLEHVLHSTNKLYTNEGQVGKCVFFNGKNKSMSLIFFNVYTVCPKATLGYIALLPNGPFVFHFSKYQCQNCIKFIQIDEHQYPTSTHIQYPL